MSRNRYSPSSPVPIRAALSAIPHLESIQLCCKSREDDRAGIAAAIKRCTDDLKVDIVLTCGGSGLSPRDNTPEATRDVCEREVPGIAEAMRYHSLQITPYAMLSRAICMQRGNTIVINLPGSEKAARENWDGIVAALPHAVKMMAGGGH